MSESDAGRGEAASSSAIVEYAGSGAYVTARLDGVLYVSELNTPASSLMAPIAKLLKDFGDKRVSIVIASEEPPSMGFSALLRTRPQRARTHVDRPTNPKLTPKAIERARAMRSKGMSLSGIAKLLGVPQSTLQATLRRAAREMAKS